jgi:putative endonuclease
VGAEKMNGDCTLPAFARHSRKLTAVIPASLPPSFPRKREPILSTHLDGPILLTKISRAGPAFIDYATPGISESGMDKSSYVYILASGLNGTLYIGVTSNLIKRVWEHREGVVDGFSKQYGVKNLVWYEIHTEIMEAIRREKQIKKWERSWKVELIQQSNPRWRDLYADITG